MKEKIQTYRQPPLQGHWDELHRLRTMLNQKSLLVGLGLQTPNSIGSLCFEDASTLSFFFSDYRWRMRNIFDKKYVLLYRDGNILQGKLALPNILLGFITQAKCFENVLISIFVHRVKRCFSAIYYTLQK